MENTSYTRVDFYYRYNGFVSQIAVEAEEADRILELFRGHLGSSYPTQFVECCPDLARNPAARMVLRLDDIRRIEVYPPVAPAPEDAEAKSL